RPQYLSHPSRHVAVHIGEMSIFELENIDEEQQPVLSVVIHHRANRHGQELKSVPREWLDQQHDGASMEGVHAGAIGLDQLLEELFLAGIIGIDCALRDAGFLGYIADVGTVK